MRTQPCKCGGGKGQRAVGWWREEPQEVALQKKSVAEKKKAEYWGEEGKTQVLAPEVATLLIWGGEGMGKCADSDYY